MKELQRLADYPVTTTRIGLIFRGNLSETEWRHLGSDLLECKEAWQWAVADWLNYGKATHGKKYALAIDLLQRTYGTLANWCHVGSAFAMERRRAKLLFSHHAAVCEFSGLTEQAQDGYLDAAERDGLTVADLRELIRSDLAEVQDNVSSAMEGGLSPLSFLTQFTISLPKLFRELGDPEQWSKPQREAWKQELKPVVDLYARL